MKKRLGVFVIILLVGVLISSAVRLRTEPASPWSCTSFAVYSDIPLYGMNFDYSEVPVRFTIREFGDLVVFQVEFQHAGGDYSPTVGMNSKGLFASCQMLFPEMPSTPPSNTTQMSIWGLYQSGLYNQESVAEVLALVDEYQIANSSLTLHNHFADSSGSAVVVEVIDGREELISNKDNYSVMTNFPVSSIQGKPLDEIEGVGADRYRTATQEIQENIADFQVENGLRVLEETALVGEVSTQASMVFDPTNLLVYIALDHDFDKLWLVSLEEKTIRTYRGFDGEGSLPLDHQGVTEKALVEMRLSPTADHFQVINLLLPVALLSIIVLIIWYYRKLSSAKTGAVEP